MVPIHKFTIVLAERVAPDEVDVAPAIADAAAEGGPAWEQVRRVESGPVFGGAIDSIEPGTLVAVFGAIRAGWDIFAAVCERGAELAAILTFCRNVLGARDAKPSNAGEERVAHDLRRVAELLQREGLTPERADRVAAQTLGTFAEQPELGRATLAAIKPQP